MPNHLCIKLILQETHLSLFVLFLKTLWSVTLLSQTQTSSPYQWVTLNWGSDFLANKNTDFILYFCLCVNAGKIRPHMSGSHSNEGPIKMLVLEQNYFLININLLLLRFSRAHREIKILLHPANYYFLFVFFSLFQAANTIWETIYSLILSF